ncbi:MAG: lipopolysaccharide biosynthesis protein [Bacteroidaceae bacterium]|nr:lipopolysaccharide biosynthesis protein [Bacteroidaceae bacterium]
MNNKVVSAVKWSAATSIAAKLVAPLSTMILARILTPEAFGVLVTATMVISFAEIFTDAGFQKYIVQHQFVNDEQLFESTNVAFWSNLSFSLVVWAVIAVFSGQIAHLVGNDGYGLVIAVSCVCIPLTAFSSLQMALFQRWMDFRTLFLVRVVGILVPLVISIPLALVTRSYWSLIIGMIVQNAVNAILLTWRSPWKPCLFYDIHLFREMFSFTMWSMIESITIWLTGYIDVFIVGTVLSTYYMGIYRTSITLVGAITSIFTSATTPVLFSALSRLQDDNEEFRQLFFKFQKVVGLVVIPLGVGIYLFRDLITDIALGDQWGEAAYVIGLWGLANSLMIVLSHYSSEIYRAKGKPKYSVLSQCIAIAITIPTVLISIQYGFQQLCFWRSAARVFMITVNLPLVYILVRITPLQMFRNIFPSLMATLVMVAVYYLLPVHQAIWSSIINVLVCAAVYTIIISLFPKERYLLLNLKTILSKR